MAADERRSTLMKKKWLIPVHQCLSAAKNFIPGVFHHPVRNPEAERA
jgi:hypothetical protein